MKKKSSNDTIPNWTMFGAETVIIEVHTAGEDTYATALTFILDDGTPKESRSGDKVVTIFLDPEYDDVEDAIMETADAISGIFQFISQTAILVGENGEVEKEYDLEELFSIPVANTNTKVTFH